MDNQRVHFRITMIASKMKFDVSQTILHILAVKVPNQMFNSIIYSNHSYILSYHSAPEMNAHCLLAVRMSNRLKSVPNLIQNLTDLWKWSVSNGKTFDIEFLMEKFHVVKNPNDTSYSHGKIL